MTDSVVQTYFRSRQSSLYLWTDEGRALSWMDGTTIAFRQEIEVILDRLSKGSLPAFQSIIVAVAATRSSWPEVSSKLTRLVRALNESELPTYAAAMRKHRYLTDTWPATARRLCAFSEYAESKIKTPMDRAELLATLFDGFESSYSSIEQSTIATAFQVGLPEDWFFERKGDGEQFSLPSNAEEEAEWRCRPPIFHRILHDVLEFLRIARVLASNLHDWNDEALRRRIQSGVTVDLVAPESPLDETMSARELLTSLHDDAELCGFAKITRSLIAAITLPRSLDASLDIAAGGVSDISNRGQLDQLLLSELAFDDLTLAIRIATNEAMYIRRESPPNPMAKSRPVLIDTSLPLWGIPKLYATAMAMALSAQDSSTLTVRCFRADGADVVGVSLASRDDVCQQLAVMSPTEHPGLALAAFQQAVETSDAAIEPVLITTGDVLECATFQHLLNKTNFAALWIIQVERDGRLQVIQRTRQGTSIRRKIHLPVEEILSEHNADSLTRKDVPSDLPDLLRRLEFPLRLSHNVREGRVFCWGLNAISLSDDGRLMLWTQKHLGAIQLSDSFPRRSKRPPILVARDHTMIQFFLAGSPSLILTVHKHGSEVTRVVIDVDVHDCEPMAAIGPTLFFYRRNVNRLAEIIVIDRTTGKQQASVSTKVSRYVRMHGRVFRVNGIWSVVYYDGTKLEFQPLPDAFQSAKDILEYEIGRYLLIRADGKVITDDQKIQVQQPNDAAERFIGCLPGGDVVQISNRNSRVFLKLSSGEFVKELSYLSTIPTMEIHQSLKIVQLRTPHWKFRRIGLETTTGRIRLQSHKGVDYVVHWNSGKQRIELVTGGQHSVVQLAEFSDTPGVRDVGYRLLLAEWEGGNKAWLDSRGLLHLKSGNSDIPQITLALQDGPLSGWLSTGEVFGEDYYLGSSSDDHQTATVRVSDAVAWSKCIKPFLDSGPWNFHYTFDTASTGNTTLPQY